MSFKPIPLRKLGKNGPGVPPLGLGLMGMSGAYGTPPSDEERFQLLDRAVELGETFWDSSDHYRDSEELLGKWFKRTRRRDEIFLSSKFGIVVENGSVRIDSSSEYCKRACETSLKKLGIDSIDLYYASRVNFETPIEATMRAMAELKAEGKIKHIGLSEVSSTTLRRACKIAPVAAVQMEYSPFERDIESTFGTDLLKTCRELGVAIVCYSPLGRGLLTGAVSTKESVSGANDFRGSYYPRFSEENLDANIGLVNQFKTISDQKGCTPSQLAIAWLLKQGDDILPIPGTKKIRYLEENWNSLAVHLTDEEEVEIRKFVESVEMCGHRSMSVDGVVAFADTREERKN